MNTLDTPPIHCHSTGFEMAWHHLFLRVQTPYPTPSRRT